MISYRDDFGLWWPDYDKKPEGNFARARDRASDVDSTATLCRQRRVCVQAGAHAGIWPQRLSGYFEDVFTFEPDKPLYECARRNISSPNVHLSPAALGAEVGTALLRCKGSAGSSHIDPEKGYEVDVLSIDSLCLDACDAIILDVEGYEVEVLKGAAETISKFRPVLHLEELPRTAAAVRRHVMDLGYHFHHRIHGDAVYV